MARNWLRTLRRAPQRLVRQRSAELGICGLHVERLEERAMLSLVAAYAFDAGIGTTVADASGTGNVGTTSNTTWSTSGKYGNALSFNGTNAMVNIPDSASLHLTTGMTLEAWVRPSAITNAWRDVIYKGDDNYYLEATSSGSSRPVGGIKVGSTNLETSGTTALVVNTWTHLALTYDGANLRLYINGAQASSVAGTGTILTSTNPLQIGGDSIYGQRFAGLIDEVRIYNTALTAAQIQTDMNSPISVVPDTQTPTAPASLTALTASTSQINLSWPASTDNVAVTGYRVERQDPGGTSFTQIGTTTATTFNDTSLAPGTTYSYRVRATDAAGNLGAYSPVATATTLAPPETTPPSVAVTAPTGGATVSGTITISATASDNVGVAGVQFLVDGAALGAEDTTSPYSTSWNTTTATNGTHTLAARARDAAGNNTTTPSINITVDNQAPTGTIVINGGAAATNTQSVTLTLSASDALSGVTQMRFSNTGTSFSAAEAYATTKTWTLTTGAGTKTVYAQFKDAVGNWSTVAITDTIILDTTAPTISARTATNISSSSATITWTTNEAATSQVDYGLTTSYGSTSTLDPTLVTAHSVAMTGLVPNTTYNYRVRSRDAAGNEGVSANSTFKTAVGADTIAPTVVSINRVTASPTNAGVVQWTVTFSESVAGVDLADFALAASGLTGAALTNATGSGTTYTVTASSGTGSGTLELNLVDNDSIVDTSANPLGGTGAGNGTFTGQVYTIDKIMPTVTINQAAGQADPTSASPINLTVMFSEPVTGFAANDISFAGSTVGGTLTALVTGTGPTYNVAVSGMTGTGTVVASVIAAAATDAAGNASAASTSTDNTVAIANTQTAGLTAAYAFDEISGTTAADASGHAIVGTLTNGPTHTTGKYGNAIGLDGVNDYVDLGNPTALQVTGSLTLSGWINASAFPVDDAAVVSKRASGESGFQLDVTKDTGPRTIGFKLTNSSGGQMLRYGATTLQPNTWYHIAGVYDAATQSLHVYLNGQLDDGVLQGTVTASQQNSTANVNIGRRAGVTGFEFAGRVDDVRIYDRALTVAEIQTDMATPVGTIGPADPNPPVVQLDQPVEGALVSDIVVVTALATDDVAIGGVQFYVDGVLTGSLDTVDPYALTWDTRTVSNGAHTLTARAYDTSGNSAVSSPVTVNVSNTNFFRNEILATGFDLPTVIKFLPDGRLLVAEITGTIKVVPAPYTTPDPTPFLELNLNIPGYAGIQQGIMDVALDPNFVTNHYYYVFYTNDIPNRDRLSRFTANNTLDGTIAGSELVLYEDPQTADTEHHGGAINFGNDGKIYVTTGDHFQGTPAQDLTSPRGKILRFNPDGTVPSDNPFFDGAGPNYDAIWAYGLRNPYRAYYDAPTSRFFIGDVGGNDWSTAVEEVNIGVRGANYGWPNVEGTSANPNYTNPIYSYAHNGRDAAITSGFVYHGSQFPSSYQGNYFFADYTQNWIRRLTFDANGNVTGVFNVEPADGSVDGPYGDIVYLTEGPDGALYYLDLGYSDVGGTFGVSKIRRIQYIQGDLPPVVAAAATPAGAQPLTFNFSSAGSSDPEGVTLTYLWAFGDGQTSTLANPQHTYANAGLYQARLTVSDGVNSTLSPPISISAGTKPVITTLATTPANNGLFRAGDVISFSAQATDAEDGPLPASAFTWSIDFLHGGHVHPGIVSTGVTGGTFTIPSSGHDFSGDTRYRITLTVTDSDGLQATQSAIVYPEKVNLTFDTVPSGLTLYLDGIAHTAPFVYDTLIGFNHTIEARDQTASTTTYAFASWSDGGAQQHTLTVPTAAQGYTANYTVVTNPLPSGLAAGWSFNEASGTSAADTSGNNNTATLVNGVARTTGNYGGGLMFDGVNDYLTIPNSPSLNIAGSGLTLSMWIRPQALSGGDCVVLGKFWNATMTSPYYQYGLELAGGTVPTFYVGTTGGPLSASMGSALALDQWSHLAVVFDGSQVRYYLNGVLVTTASLPATITARGNPFRIGADNNTQQFFKGSLDEVRIYNRALSIPEVQADMTTPVGSPLQLLGEAIASSAVAVPLTTADIRPLFNEAVSRWKATLGYSQAARKLNQARVDVVDLPNTTLGLAASSIVFVDMDAAGYGWFLDPTPWEDSEFAEGLTSGAAKDKVDLLSVLTHELGHILGLDDDHLADPFATNDVMADALPLGVRRSPLHGTLSAPSSVLDSQTVAPAVTDLAPAIPRAAHERVVDALWEHFDPFDWLAIGKRERMRRRDPQQGQAANDASFRLISCTE